jgi:VWFA-related protein
MLCRSSILIAITFLSIQTIGQTPASYSESRVYVPRVFADAKEKKRSGKSKEPKDAPVSTVAAATPHQIELPVSVLDAKGSLVNNVNAREFKVFFNDVEAEIVSVEKSAAPRNIILLVDMSPSGDLVLKENKELIRSIVDSIDGQDMITVAQFSDKLKVLAEPTTDRARILKAIDRLKFASGTSLYDSVDEISSEMVAKLTGRTVLIIVTDGVDTTSNEASFESSLVAAERTNMTVFAVYIDTFLLANQVRTRPIQVPGLPPLLMQQKVKGLTIKEYETGRLYLNDLVLLSGGRAISDGSPLHAAMPGIGEQLKNEYVLKVIPKSPIPAGERASVRVRLERPNLAVMVRGSYFYSP